MSREFLVGEARELSESRFDRWIGEGLGLAKMLLGARFDQKVSSFPPYWFVWSGGSGARLLTGRIAPSEDGAGRKHPFALFGYCDARRSNGLAAASFPPIAEQVHHLWERVAAAPTPPAVLDLVRQEPGSGDLDGLASYRSYTAECPAERFWGARASERYQVMQAFVETLVPMKGRDPREIRMAIRFPLSGDPSSAALDAAFWVDLASRRLGKKLDRASCFWNQADDLYLFFSEPTGPQWTCLADRDANIETVSFLDRPYGSEPERRMDRALRGLLDAPSATLVDYLNWAGRSVM